MEKTNEAFNKEFSKAKKLSGDSYAALGRIAGVTRQAVGLWYSNSTVPIRSAKKIVAEYPQLDLMTLVNL